MKIADVKKDPNGETTIEYLNGYTFIGDVDEKGFPTCGTIIAPNGGKYIFADLEGKDIIDVFESIENGDCDMNLITELK